MMDQVIFQMTKYLPDISSQGFLIAESDESLPIDILIGLSSNI